MRTLFFLLFGSLIISCNTPTTSTDSLAQKEIVKVSNTVATSAYPESMPPVYENFEEMASIFNQETDTTYIINFWATWCKPCVEELPYFEQLTEQYKNQKVKVILVSLDFKKQLATKLLPFIKERNIQSEVVVLLDPDANAWVNRVDPSWSGAIPVTLVYKKDKRAFYEESFEDLAALDNIVKPFL